MPQAMSRKPPLVSPIRRRDLLAGMGTAALAGAFPRRADSAPTRPEPAKPALPASAPLPQPSPEPPTRVLTAQPAKLRLRPAPAAETEIWAFDGATPGPPLRIRQGETLRLKLENKTTAPLSLHWQGLRGAAAQDGVGGFSQPAVAPGASAEIQLTPPDAGSFLYRPLVIGGSSEPAGRGLSGLLVVEEREPPPVDLDLPLVVTDWLLGDDQTIQPFMLQSNASATAGRLGSWLTVSGKAPPYTLRLPPRSRIRLRLANACNARIMRLRFDDAKASVIAVDGQPTEPFEPVHAQLPFAPGTRYDVVLDLPEAAGASLGITALVGPGLPLLRLVTEGPAKPARPQPAVLKLNPALPAAVRMQDALRPSVVIEGGAKPTPDRTLDFSGLDLARPWTVNGGTGSAEGKPLFSVKRGTPVVMAIDNRTAFIQPIHIHGHAVRLLHPLDDGWENYFLDTVQIPEGKKLHVAFIADNPGRWLISSSVLERFDLGLWGWFEVM